MAINLQKTLVQDEYYYLKDGNEFGPFDLMSLIKQISGDTLVRKTGCELLPARKIPELQNFFPSQANANPKVDDQPNVWQPSPPLNKKSFFNNLFSFNGRIKRKEYGISVAIFLVLYYIFFFLILEGSGTVLASILFIPLFWFMLAKGAQRCHDCGNSGWFQLIPFYVVYLLFAEGTNGPNEYGNNPGNI